ncbi:MAG: DUF423 domain-containing protein [Methylococcaceae bacterium]
MPHQVLLLLAAVDALLAVAAGAFGAHALKGIFNDYQMGIFHTAVEYQMWHALGLGLIAVIVGQIPNPRKLILAGWIMQAGIVLFSGSLYALALTGIKALGLITPAGGVAFLVAWGFLIVEIRANCSVK